MLKIIIGLVIILALIALGPWLTIWALNTLFPALAIPFNLSTWAAVILLGAFFRANVNVKRTD